MGRSPERLWHRRRPWGDDVLYSAPQGPPPAVGSRGQLPSLGVAPVPPATGNDPYYAWSR
jgi:hypothetical protein